MHSIEYTFISLLADVSALSGYSEIRGSYEGLHWCLHVAPQLEKQVLEAIESGVLPDLEQFPSWLRRLVAGSFVDPEQLRWLRQLLLFCYKANVAHDKQTTDATFKSYLDTNLATGRSGSGLNSLDFEFLERARKHCQYVLRDFRAKNIIPAHGPGAVTTRKNAWSHRYSTLEYLYPSSDYMALMMNQDHLGELDECVWPDHITAKLIAVPKDSRGPRLICVHPAEAIWLQKGLQNELQRVINARRYPHYRADPRGYVRFEDQSVNGRIALISSRSRRWATMDMKEASDRISDPLVQYLFGEHYKWFGACRAQKFWIPGHSSYAGTYDIHSYAPMGNATTFPVQSLVFWALCVAGMQSRWPDRPAAAFVFGDDIEVPTYALEEVMNRLESVGLLVNRRKTFYKGYFRESCGVDAFKGVNVTPLRWKSTIDIEDLKGLQSSSDLAMRLRVAGYEETARCLYNTIRRTLRRRFGVGLHYTNNVDHGGLAEYTDDYLTVRKRCFRHLERQLAITRVWRVEPLWEVPEGCRWNDVMESLTRLEQRSAGIVPERALPRALRLKRGWTEVR